MRFESETKLLGLLALVLLLGVYYVAVKPAPERLPTEGMGQALVPGFAEVADRAVRISVSGEDSQTTLVFDGETWRVEERDGYPASQALVNGLLRGLATTVKADPKTADATYFDRLGLNERARRIVVNDSAGDILADLVTGDQFYAPTGEGIMTFVFDEQTDRAWTASNLPQLSQYPAYWLRAEVVGISELRLKRLTVQIGDAEVWSIAKTEPSDPAFELDGASTGPRPNQRMIDDAAYAVTGFYLEDVASIEDQELFKVGTATYATFDGLSIVMTFYDREGYIWTSFEAQYDPDVLLAEDTPQVLPDVPLDGAAEANALNAEWRGRIFQLPIETLAAILKRRQDLSSPQGPGQ